jgi:hypothetical protein
LSGLAILGAGFGRTGTTSLKRALEILGCGPCYHMQTAMTRPGHGRHCLRAQQGREVDFRHFLRGYRSAIDWPVCEFLPRLLPLYPDARVILTVRDPERWYESVRETLWEVDRQLPWWFPPSIRRMHEAVIWKGRFGGRFLDRAHAIAAYRAHVDEVRRTVPAERLLVFDVAQGWAPLCAFLGRAVPDEPFPQLNDRRFFRRLLRTLRVAGWAVPAALAAGVLGLAMRYGA